MSPPLSYSAPRAVQALIDGMARTEDVRFSPNNRRMAVACFARNRIAVYDVTIGGGPGAPPIEMTGCVELSSPALDNPHGLDFVDDDTLIVANRRGDIVMLPVPAGGAGAPSIDVAPIATWPAGGASLLRSPGSVAVIDDEVLVCNNSGHTVTSHPRDGSSGRVVVRRWLDIPDGLTVSPDRRWLAVSNHNVHAVFLYERSPGLGEQSDPEAMLRGVEFPHGLRFTADGTHLFVADAGAPHVHVFRRDGGRWSGVYYPAATIRIMDEPTFQRGRHNPQEGGPKGLDIDRGGHVMALTCEFQTVAFFDVSTLVRTAADAPPPRALQYELSVLPHGARERAELAQMTIRARDAEWAVGMMNDSGSWRVTAPLRWVGRLLGRDEWRT